MRKSRFLTATTIATAVAALGATLAVDQAAAQSRRGVFAHQDRKSVV